jgi:hypothetical protein
VFVAEDRTVTLTVGGPGHVVSRPKGLDCGAGHDGCSADFPWGTKLRLVPVPGAVGRFARWGAACWNFGAGACTLTVRRELSEATAAFGHAAPAADPQHLTITLIDSGPQHVTSTPAGIDCPAVCDASFPAGTPVALRGTVSTIWSGDCQTQETSRCAVIVDAPTNVRVVAHSVFKPQPPPVRGGGGYGVNVTVNGKGRVTAPGINCGGPEKSLRTCQGLFGTQAAVILTAKPEKHSAFLGWNQFCRAKGKNPHCRVVVLASVNVGALFQR